MLSSFGLSRVFWAQVVRTTSCLINLYPSTALEYKTPNEVWHGKTPSYKHLRVFGCATYAHIRQDKLQPRPKKCIFLGYPKGMRGYRLWCIDLGSGWFLMSRNLIFNEKDMPLLKTTQGSSTAKMQV